MTEGTKLLRLEGDLTLWFQNCDVGFTCKTPAEAEHVFSILKSSMELGLGIVIRGIVEEETK